MIKPAGVDLPIKVLRSGYEKNSQGWGLMRPSRSGVFVKKGVSNFADFLKHYKFFKDTECAIHFRVATCGGVNYQNAHPFQVGTSGIHMMHNGHFGNIPILDKAYSDSYHFAQSVASSIDHLRSKDYQDFLAAMTPNNKIVFCDSKGLVVIDREHWIEDSNGVLYSNFYGWKSPTALWKQYKQDREGRFYRMPHEVAAQELPYEEEVDTSIYPISDARRVALLTAFDNGEEEQIRKLMGYDREEEMADRDMGNIAQMALISQRAKEIESLDITGISKLEMVELCRTSPEIMADVMIKSVRAM